MNIQYIYIYICLCELCGYYWNSIYLCICLFIYIKMREKGKKKNRIIPKIKSFIQSVQQLWTNNHENNSVNVVNFISYETNLLKLSVKGNFAENKLIQFSVDSVQFNKCVNSSIINECTSAISSSTEDNSHFSAQFNVDSIQFNNSVNAAKLLSLYSSVQFKPILIWQCQCSQINNISEYLLSLYPSWANRNDRNIYRKQIERREKITQKKNVKDITINQYKSVSIK